MFPNRFQNRRNRWIAAVLFALPAGAMAEPAAKPMAVFPNTCACTGCEPTSRWQKKTDPGDAIPGEPVRSITPYDIARWAGPGGVFTEDMPRITRETEWYEVTGRVTLIRLSPDGDLGVQIVDEDAMEDDLNVTVAVPWGVPWCAIRAQLFELTTARLPLRIRSEVLLPLKRTPVITVAGHPFYDADHADRANRSNRRPGAYRLPRTVWEIHPVMKLRIVDPDRRPPNPALRGRP